MLMMVKQTPKTASTNANSNECTLNILVSPFSHYPGKTDVEGVRASKTAQKQPRNTSGDDRAVDARTVSSQ
jgi:hypothetical protein